MTFRRSESWWREQPLGKDTDANIARALGCARRTVTDWRSKLGIPRYEGAYSTPTDQRWSPAAGYHSTIPATPSLPELALSSAPQSPPTLRSVRHPTMLPPTTAQMAETHRILFVPDVHVPYHDERAWRTMLAVGQMWKPTCVVVLGDFLDLLCVSFHPKKPNVRLSLDDEICTGRDKLDELDALRAWYKYYVGGNHEHRLTRFIASHAPMFDGLLSVPELLGLERRGWEWTEYGDGRQIGELFVTHDLNIAGKYAVRRSMDAAWSSTIIGHTHRLEVVHQTDGRGRPCVGASFGWLGDFDAIDYQKKKITTRQWRHGLGLVHMDEQGNADVRAVPIHNGSCIVEGQRVTADDLNWSRAG